MISAKLIELIEIQSDRITRDVTDDLTRNERTRAFRRVPRHELDARIAEILHHLGNWVGEPKAERVQAEFTEWGGKRFGQGIPLSEIVYAVILIKQHLRRHVADAGLVDAAFPRVESDYILPMHLHSLQELNAQLGQFFDEAIYHLARGYEAAAGRKE